MRRDFGLLLLLLAACSAKAEQASLPRDAGTPDSRSGSYADAAGGDGCSCKLADVFCGVCDTAGADGGPCDSARQVCIIQSDQGSVSATCVASTCEGGVNRPSCYAGAESAPDDNCGIWTMIQQQ